ncbi:MAG: gliding motility-associated C-terminal domain-containing protein [Bacteroidia bacterium]|jgi:gliding motility-associated-like protein
MKRNAMKLKSGLLIALALVAVQLYSQPNWQINPADFQYTMTVTGKGYFNCLLSANPANKVGAFVNGECRGYASFNTPVNGSNFAFLTIYSNVAQGSAVTFKMYNATSNTIVDCPVGITFNEGQIVGNDVQPYAFKTEYLLESLNLPNTSLFDYTTAGTAISQPTLLNELGQTVPGTFSFVNDAQGPDNGSFSITPAGLVINQNVDFITQDTFRVHLSGVSAGGCVFDSAFVLPVVNTNIPPQGLLVDTLSVNENEFVATLVGQLQADDPSVGDAHIFTFMPSMLPSTDYASFTIQGANLLTAVELNYEAQSYYHLAVKVQDQTGSIAYDTLVVQVLDVPDLSALLVDTMSITENATLATVVGILQPNFVSSNNSYTYTHLPSNDFAAFNLVVDQVSSATEINYETQSTYHLAFQIDDVFGNTVIDTLVIQVIDVEEMTGLLVDTFSISENVPLASFVGQLQPNFTNAGVNYTYSYLPAALPSNDYAAFALTADQLSTAALINFETQDFYHLAIQLQDDLGNTIVDTLVVEVLDVLDLSALLVDTMSITENASLATLVGTLQPNFVSTNNSYTYTHLPSADFAAFSLTVDQVSSVSAINYETQAWYHLAIQIDDAYGNSAIDTLVVQVIDVEEMTGLLVDTFTINENIPVTTFVGQLQPNFVNVGATYTYSYLPAVLPSSDYAAFTLATDQVSTAALINFEGQNVYHMAVQLSDDLGNNIIDTLVVQVLNIPDVTSLLVDSLTINENTALASLVIALQPDYVSANNSFTYNYAPTALPSNDYAAFSLTADQLTVAAQINFEAQAYYHLAIQIDDVFGNTVFDTLVIQVLDLPEMTGLLVDSLSIDENVSLSTLVGLLQPNFVNEGIAYSYSFDETSLPSADYTAFGIADDQLETAAELNYEQQVWYYLALQIDDELGNVIHDTLVVRVLDVIELDDLKAGNLLTPDADGHNDTFSIPSIELYANYVLHVYNAIGNLVYEAKQYDNSWTGLTNSGTELPSGTYYYVFQDSTNADRSFKGQLHIYRPNKF